MSNSTTDRNLLFGILALQMGFITREQLVSSTSLWLADKSRALDAILNEQGALSESDRELLMPLVDRHIENHSGDVEQSLAAVRSIKTFVPELRQLGDDDLNRSLRSIGSQTNDDADEGTEATVIPAKDGAFRYHILRPHAKGGLGEVSVAMDSELNREVALKQIQSRHAHDDESQARFLLEAEVTGGLEHPGIVPVYGLGKHGDGRPYYAMRFIRGDSLQEAVDHFHKAAASGRLTGTGYELERRQLLGRFVDVCNAIAYAHSRGVLHPDIKPGNIMLGKYGETLVVDWGLAKVRGRVNMKSGEATLQPSSESGTAPTQMGSALGTPSYMPPEQAAGQLDKLGPQSDVYSLGATLYYVLTGEKPVQGDDLASVLGKVRAGDIVPPRTLHQNTPAPLNAICVKAMSLEPEGRYDSPLELAAEVDRYLADEPVTAHADSLSVKTRRWMRNNPGKVSGLAATILVGIVSAVTMATVVSGKNSELANANRVLAQTNRELDEANDELDESNTELTSAKERTDEVLKFFTDSVLAVARPAGIDGGLGMDTTVAEALAHAKTTLASTFDGSPRVESDIRATLGATEFYRGNAQEAREQFVQALDLISADAGIVAEHIVKLKI